MPKIPGHYSKKTNPYEPYNNNKTSLKQSKVNLKNEDDQNEEKFNSEFKSTYGNRSGDDYKSLNRVSDEYLKKQQDEYKMLYDEMDKSSKISRFRHLFEKPKVTSRWSQTRIFQPGLPTFIPFGLDDKALKAFLVRVRLDEINQRLGSEVVVEENERESRLFSENEEAVYDDNGKQISSLEAKNVKI